MVLFDMTELYSMSMTNWLRKNACTSKMTQATTVGKLYKFTAIISNLYDNKLTLCVEAFSNCFLFKDTVHKNIVNFSKNL